MSGTGNGFSGGDFIGKGAAMVRKPLDIDNESTILLGREDSRYCVVRGS